MSPELLDMKRQLEEALKNPPKQVETCPHGIVETDCYLCIRRNKK